MPEEGAASSEVEEELQVELPPAQPQRQRRGRQRTRLEDLPPDERILRQIQMGDADLFLKNGVAIRKSWSFRSGVTELYPPYYDGWRNGKTVKGLYENYLDQGEPGYTLSSVVYNERYFKQTGGEFVNYYSLVWVPEAYAFSLYTPSSFNKFKETVRGRIHEARLQYAERDRFETFQDYMAFKFGRDEEMENFVDGYWIEAMDSDEHLTFFFTSEFTEIRGRKKKVAFVRPLIATATYMVIRNKLLRLDVVKEFDGQDDIPALLDFTDTLRRDMKRANRPGETR